MSAESTNDINNAYEKVWTLCPEPLDLGPTWGTRKVDGCRALIKNGPAALQALREAHSDDTLLAAHIICRDDGGEARLNSSLCGNSGAVIALRHAPDRAPFDLLISEGLLSQRTWPAIAALHDAATARAAKDNNDTVFAAETIEDAVVLRRAGLPATTMAGLHGLSKRKLMQLAALFGDDEAPPPCRPTRGAAEPARSATAEGAAPNPAGPDSAAVLTQTATEQDLPAMESEQCRLVLVGWSPYRLSLELPSDIPFLAKHFYDTRRALGIDVSRIVVWRPQADHLKNMRTQADFRDFDLFAATLRKSAQINYDLAEFDRSDNRFPPDNRRSPTDLLDAAADLAAQLEHHRHRSRTEALHNSKGRFETLLNAQIGDPLRQAAMADDDPLVKSTALLHAELNMQLHRIMPYMQEWEGVHLEQQPSKSRDDDLFQALKMQMALLGRSESLVRFIQRSRKQQGHGIHD
jgi:hypothetical protein